MLQCKIIENLLFSGLANLSSDEHKAIYLDFVMRHAHLRPNTEEFKLAIKSDSYFNALRVKFGYAVTCHKAQGSEWSNVMLDCSYIHNQLSEDYFRWLYTAMTRASSHLYLMNEPHFSIFDNMNKSAVQAIPQENGAIQAEQSKMNPDVDSQDIDKIFGIKDAFLLSLFHEISAKIALDDIEIIDIVHNSYQEIYTFEKNNERCRGSFSYSSKEIVTSISFVETNDLSNVLRVLLSSIKGHLISTKVEDTLIFSEDFLEEFYNSLKEVLIIKSIIISNVEHNNWMERYTFTRENEIAVIDFYYNKKGQLKSPTPNNLSNSTHLVNDILESLS